MLKQSINNLLVFQFCTFPTISFSPVIAMKPSSLGAKRYKATDESRKYEDPNPISKKSRVEQPANVCFVSSVSTMNQLLQNQNQLMDLILAVNEAIENNAAIVALAFAPQADNQYDCSDNIGATLRNKVVKECMKPVLKSTVVPSVICLYFVLPEVERVIDPENGFPAVVTSLGSFVSIASSWPYMPLRVAKRVLADYVKHVRESVKGAAQPAEFAIGIATSRIRCIAQVNIAEGAGLNVISNEASSVFSQAANAPKHFKLVIHPW